MKLGTDRCPPNTSAEGARRAVRAEIGLAGFKILVYCAKGFLSEGCAFFRSTLRSCPRRPVAQGHLQSVDGRVQAFSEQPNIRNIL